MLFEAIKGNVNSNNEEFLNSEKYTLVLGATTPLHADVSFVNASNELDTEAFKNWRSDYKDAEFIREEDKSFKVGREVEKMSKSKYNVVNPDDIVTDYEDEIVLEAWMLDASLWK